ncbi:TPA: hypothetical protein DD455_04735, partial [Candidatus Shapirobacteria bacterium]|nr:hypothetical protein [Candidatus Shapirobacteria bacterium]
IDLTKSVKKTDEEEPLVLPQKETEKVAEFIGSLPSVGREEEVETINEVLETKDEISEERETEKVVAEEKKSEVAVEEKTEEGIEEKKEEVGRASLGLKTEKLGATGRAVFGEIPMPDIPDLPNLVVGMVMDKNDKIVEGAIVEIQDKEGHPSRVLKTNQLGQFKILTQLSDGKYLVVTEKEGLEFDRVEINLDGNIVKPIKILAK